MRKPPNWARRALYNAHEPLELRASTHTLLPLSSDGWMVMTKARRGDHTQRYRPSGGEPSTWKQKPRLSAGGPTSPPPPCCNSASSQDEMKAVKW